jgi:hypothetical protein
MPDFNNPVMDHDDEVFNTSQNILDNEKPNFFRQVISGPITDLWHAAIETEIDALQRNYTWDMVYRPMDRKILDSKWVFKIECLTNGSVDKFKP